VSQVLNILCSWPFLWSTYQPTIHKTCAKLCDSRLRSQSDRSTCPSRSSRSMSVCVNCSRSRREEPPTFTAGVLDGVFEVLQMSRKAFLNAFSFATGDFSDYFRVGIPRIEKVSSATSKSKASNDSDKALSDRPKNVLVTNRSLHHESAGCMACARSNELSYFVLV
jgi:hypothetical protein